MLAPYQGRCLGVGQLNALLKAVTDHYLDRGYVTTRAYLRSRTWPPGPCASSSSKAAWRAWTAPRWPARANWR
ncbi:POTRA domain-containing protein [Pseudomonas aeruginosa]